MMNTRKSKRDTSKISVVEVYVGNVVARDKTSQTLKVEGALEDSFSFRLKLNQNISLNFFVLLYWMKF